MTQSDGIKWNAHARVLKYDQETVDRLTRELGHEPSGAELRALGTPYEVSEAVGNLLTTAGLARITNLITGGGGAAFNNAQAIVGVGSSATAAAVGDTALGGNGSTSTAYYQGADATYPSTANGVITCYATFATGNANFAWNEWCFAVGTGTITPGGTLASVATSPVLLNHRVQSLGTKSSGAWTLQATITLS